MALSGSAWKHVSSSGVSTLLGASPSQALCSGAGGCWSSSPAPAQGYVTVGVGIVCLCQSATIIHLIGLSGRRVPPGRACALLSELGPPFPLTFTRYCCCLNCMVYGIRRESRGGGRILRKRRAIVLQSCEQCRWAGQYQND